VLGYVVACFDGCCGEMNCGPLLVDLTQRAFEESWREASYYAMKISMAEKPPVV